MTVILYVYIQSTNILRFLFEEKSLSVHRYTPQYYIFVASEYYFLILYNGSFKNIFNVPPITTPMYV